MQIADIETDEQRDQQHGDGEQRERSEDADHLSIV